MWQPDGESFRCVSCCETRGDGQVVVVALRDSLPADSLPARVIRERRVLQFNDVPNNVAVPPKYQEHARIGGYRVLMAVPMLCDDVAVGVITVNRADPTEFTDVQLELLKTFADQAVIATENVRLFKELQTSNRDLTTALDKQTATADILGVISRSQTDVQPVFDAILTSAIRLLRVSTGFLTRIVENQQELVALKAHNEGSEAAIRALFPQPLQSESVTAQAIRDRTPLNIVDYEVDSRVSERARVTARLHGYRSWVVVPMLRRADPVGAILIARREPGGFGEDEIALLQTFADQAVIAIENVRLFKELDAANRELAAA
ncbi:MAG TPA: GAF domain-containing protein, partial [Gemmatimonadales bacterium]|nr:GAF domain-containing protein [Gemmatimonadales bacterium]